MDADGEAPQRLFRVIGAKQQQAGKKAGSQNSFRTLDEGHR
jgi:hypothetical protein